MTTIRETPVETGCPTARGRPSPTSRALAEAMASVLAPFLLAALAACGGEAAGGADGSAGASAGDGPGTAAEQRAPPAPPGCEELAALPADSMQAVGDEGLRVLRRSEGEGRAAAAGDTMSVHYVGCLTDGTKFDASYDRGRPITFPLGQGRVIAGWDRGIEGMKPGGVAVLRIPPELGYGARGTPQGPIPPNATLVFHVRLVDVTPAGESGGG